MEGSVPSSQIRRLPATTTTGATATTTTPGTATTSTATTTGNGNSLGATAGSAPAVREQVKTKTRFFDMFLSAKQIERNQKHAEVMAAIKAYSKIEKQLTVVNNRLDELIKLLTIATEGGTKSVLLAAANEAKNSLSTYYTLLTNFNSSHSKKNLTNDEIDIFQLHKIAANSKYKALRALWRQTSNISEDVRIKVKEVVDQSKSVFILHQAFVEKHHETKVPKTQSQGMPKTPIDVDENGSESECTDED